MPKVGKDLLSDASVKSATYGDKPGDNLKRDGGGLYLVVEPADKTGKSKKWWKLRTVYAKKENSFSLGEYPTVTLAKAREQREAIRKQIAAGVDPAVARKEVKAKAGGAGSFEEVAREWHKTYCHKWTTQYSTDMLHRLEIYIFPWLVRRPISEISSPEMLAVIKRIAAKGTLETANRMKQTCGAVFRYAMATGKATQNPVDALRESIPSAKPKHMAAPTEPKDVAPLLRMICGYDGSFIVACALRLAPLVFVRPGELRQAEWAAIDLDQAEWRYTASKTNTDHLVPLSRQAVAVLTELYPLTGTGRYVFPSTRSTSRPMSDNTINAAMRRMGIDTKTELTGHGFRAMARTILDEVLGFRPELIEHQLAHAVRDPLGRAYNRTKHLPERKAMMQAWADYLDKLKAGAEIIPIRAAG